MTDLHPRLQAVEQLLSVSSLTQIVDAELSARQVELWIKRDDLLHPILSGNKWRKLKYILNHALQNGYETVISMGGAYSNHLHALAFLGQVLGIKTAAFIRGEKPGVLNPTLVDLQCWGMDLRFVSRFDYRQLRGFKGCDSLPELAPAEYWLPEGGSVTLALQGVAEIFAEVDRAFDVLMSACGTGTTLAGLIAAAPKTMHILGVATLKNAGFLGEDVQQLLSGVDQPQSWEILVDYHFGGFAKTRPELSRFIQQFSVRHGVVLEPVYTGKVLFAFYDLLQKGYFKPGQRVLMLHTGGLQGSRSPVSE